MRCNRLKMKTRESKQLRTVTKNDINWISTYSSKKWNKIAKIIISKPSIRQFFQIEIRNLTLVCQRINPIMNVLGNVKTIEAIQKSKERTRTKMKTLVKGINENQMNIKRKLNRKSIFLKVQTDRRQNWLMTKNKFWKMAPNWKCLRASLLIKSVVFKMISRSDNKSSLKILITFYFKKFFAIV